MHRNLSVLDVAATKIQSCWKMFMVRNALYTAKLRYKAFGDIIEAKIQKEFQGYAFNSGIDLFTGYESFAFVTIERNCVHPVFFAFKVKRMANVCALDKR